MYVPRFPLPRFRIVATCFRCKSNSLSLQFLGGKWSGAIPPFLRATPPIMRYYIAQVPLESGKSWQVTQRPEVDDEFSNAISQRCGV